MFAKYKSIILYLLFGVGTTLVNFVAYYLCSHVFGLTTMPSTIIAWVAAVLFAYLTNRTWVFESKENTKQGILKEIGTFFGCRLFTGIIDWLCMFICVDLLSWNDMIVKLADNILVIILNYIASKLIVFRKK